MSTLEQRFKAAFDLKRHSYAELARAAEVKQPSVFAWFSGETKTLKGASLIRAAAYLDVQALWLLEGKGPMRGNASRPAWPFPNVDEEVICALDRDTLIALGGGLHLQAAQMGLNLRNSRVA